MESNEQLDPSNLAGGRHVFNSDWTTTVEYFLANPEYILRVQREVEEFVRLEQSDGEVVAVLCPAEEAEQFNLTEQRYWARQQLGAASDASTLPMEASRLLDEQRMANPRAHVDVSLGYAVEHFGDVLRHVARDEFVYVRSDDGQRLAVFMRPETRDYVDEMEEDYLARSSDEVLADPANEHRLSQAEVEASWEEGDHEA